MLQGKVIATILPEDAVRHILKVEGMPRLTERTLTDPDGFVAAVASVRNDGYAIDDRENEVDGRCVAVPFALSRIYAAVSLSAPSSRLSMDDVPGAARRLHVMAADLARAVGERRGVS
jgi:IclR family acetate operon transcriptional repressor